jgi:hypothetical protein
MIFLSPSRTMTCLSFHVLVGQDVIARSVSKSLINGVSARVSTMIGVGFHHPM